MVANHLDKINLLDKVGGAYYLTGLQDSIPSASNVEHYAQIVLDRANERSTIAVLHEASEGIYNGDLSADEAQGKVFDLSDNIDPKGFVNFGSFMPQTLDTLEIIAKDGIIPGIKTGHVDLDKKIGGFKPGDLVIIGARPSMGKTSFAMGIAKDMGSSGVPLAICSIESGGSELAMRYLLQARPDDDTTKIQEGIVTSTAVKYAKKEAEAIQAYPIWIDDSGLQTIDQIRARARRLKSQHDIQVLFVDYLQLMSGSKADSRRLEIGEYTRKLKLLAKDLHITVACLSQLSRAPELRNKNDRRPLMADLRESGDIEQDADIILFLYRPTYYGLETEMKGKWKDRDNTNLAEVIIAKQRNGPTGMVELNFFESKAMFTDREQYLSDDDRPESDKIATGDEVPF
jgi:replicative DNA helicase